MKNLFDYATKELSQDAFLSWFIANCNDPDIGEYSYKFINLITGYDFKPGDIKDDVVIKPQEHNIDIVVDFWTKDNLHYVIIIEDKTTSSAHSGQLKKYARTMDKWNNKEKDYINRRRKVFYKVNYLSEQDMDELKKGNEGYAEQDQWRKFDIRVIHSFFSQIPLTKSEILNSYVEHIKTIYSNINSTSFPDDNNIDKWVGYFCDLKKRINIKCYMEVGEYQSRYAYLKVRPCGFEKNKTPYLEIRSRDCLNKDNNKVLNARILLYGVDIKEDEKKKYKEAIDKTNLFHSENNKEQIGSMLKRKQTPKQFDTVKEYEDAVKSVIEKYLSIFGQI